MTTTRNPLAGTVYTETLRGVRCVRLSVLTDETTSPERQRDADDIAAGALNIDFSDGDGLREAVDLDVSASKISPFDRPALGSWLARPNEFDALVWWRFDRAIRSMGDMHDLAKWAKQHRKMLVFAEGIGGGRLVFDFRNAMDPMSELMMMMLAFAAQVESQSISDRVTGAMAAMRKMPLRWRGSRPSYGYMPAPMPAEHGGKGWTLVPDQDAVKIIERIVRELLEGVPVSLIGVGLNSDKVPSPRDHWAVKNERAKGGKTGGAKGEHVVRDVFKWTGAVITRLLRNENLLGWKMHQGKPVRDTQGNPVMATETPVMTREEFDRVGVVLNARGIDNRERSDTDSLLLRVIHCDACGGRMYLNKQDSRQRPTYKCNPHSRGFMCDKSANIRGDWADEYVTAEFLRLVGPIQTKHVVEIPGYDPEPELRATLAEFAEHQEQKGRQKSRHAANAWQERADALDARIADLETREKREPQRIVTPTGRTFADEWAQQDTAGRRAMLVEAGVRLDVRRGVRGGWRKLDTRRVDFTMRGELDPAAEGAAVAAADTEAEAGGTDIPPVPGSTARLTEPTAEPVHTPTEHVADPTRERPEPVADPVPARIPVLA
ncbi:recombinase family protein [Streptomyces sp. NBC_01506]|uniref:recombinase family protein n=1 Tax=Streptomyces sp. NBC_01506 TaxID=2903887 RepID=UPI00386CBB3E